MGKIAYKNSRQQVQPVSHQGRDSMRRNLKEARQRAGMTQQQMADRLDIGLRHYQKLEAGDSMGSFEVWDALEDILGIHQRKLREMSDKDPVPKENQ
ncbi:MAG: helix-turn-helix transcriptional regulator [Muribaculum sp.]|nr:helix-turn-helix transcriptional regulator [Muribaculum sp.]